MRFGDKFARGLCVVAMTGVLLSPVAHAQEGNAELLEKLDFLQQQIDELRQQLEQTKNQADETDARVEAVAEVIDEGAFEVASVQKTTIGG